MWELDHKEGRAPKNRCLRTVVMEKAPESPLDCKEIQPVHPKGNQTLNTCWKDCCWSWSSSRLATWCKELTHWKRPWCWERLRAGGEGGDRGWDGWITNAMDRSLGSLREVVRNREARRAPVHGVLESQTRLSDWTTTRKYSPLQDLFTYAPPSHWFNCQRFIRLLTMHWGMFFLLPFHWSPNGSTQAFISSKGILVSVCEISIKLCWLFRKSPGCIDEFGGECHLYRIIFPSHHIQHF